MMKKLLVITMVALTAACSSNKSMIIDYGAADAKSVQKIDPSIGYQALEQAPVCCSNLSQLNYQKISAPGKVDFTLTTQDPAFQFRTGKSFVKAVELPEVNGPIKVAVSSPIVTSVFAPTLLVLDKNFDPIDVYGKETINYENGSLLNIDRFFGNVELPAVFRDGRQAKYLVVLTTDQAMQQTTKLDPPDPKAVELGREADVVKMYSNQPIAHTATGVFRLAFDYAPGAASSANDMVEQQNSADALISEPAAASTASAVAVSSAKTKTSPIQPETEAMFNQLIENAVKASDFDKALSFVEEAERAGSTSARKALVEAMKKHH
ncbi:MalM family protein [Agarivorans sp. JK6]|uniref:MalM family protein n=1 Tax=Agarivorans sp. JK6 TaxID=2997426 RepID=UPI0038731281